MNADPSVFTFRTANRSHELVSLSRDWGLKSASFSVGGRVAAPEDDIRLVNGTFVTSEIGRSIRVCSYTLSELHDNDRTGTVGRSLMLVLPLEGTPLRYTFNNGQKLTLEPGRFGCFAVADEATLTARCRRADQTRALVVQLSPDGLDDEELSEKVQRLLKTNSVRSGTASERVRALSSEFSMPRHQGIVGRLMVQSCVLELIARALSCDTMTPGSALQRPSDVAKMLRIRDLLVAEPGDSYNLFTLAREAGVSVSTLKSKFRAVVGQPLFAFLRETRLQRARQGLEHGEWTVAQASAFVGYRHPTNFSTAFRKKFGISPQEARQRSYL